jgi:uncharacterized repeat protein (TIGR03803 family)
MTFDGGVNGNGVIYRFDLESHQYTVLHTFSALDANGNNEDGANPGVALTRGLGIRNPVRFWEGRSLGNACTF